VQKGIAEFLHHFTFRAEPVVQGTAGVAALGKPELVRALLDLSLCPEMLFRGQDSRRRKVGVDQLDAFFAVIPALFPAAIVKLRPDERPPAHSPRGGFELRVHDCTSMTELSEP
jgi:hypothetical protein